MTASSIPMPRLPSAAVAAAAVWFGLAVLAGATGFLARLPFPGPQLIILTLVVATFAAGPATWVTLHAVTPGVQPVLTLPLVVIPTFFVPIFLANHVFIFRRLLAAGRSSDGR